MRLNKEHFWRDRFYDYAVKLAAATFKRSIGTGSIFGGIDSMLEGAKRRTSMCDAHYLNFLYSREIYRFGQQQFLNVNFVWNQDEVSQNSRYAKRFYYSR